MTLNGVMAVILRYFSEFAYLPGVLRESSRSLSHLLMSSCINSACLCEASRCLSNLFFTARRTCNAVSICPSIYYKPVFYQDG